MHSPRFKLKGYIRWCFKLKNGWIYVGKWCLRWNTSYIFNTKESYTLVSIKRVRHAPFVFKPSTGG